MAAPGDIAMPAVGVENDVASFFTEKTLTLFDALKVRVWRRRTSSFRRIHRNGQMIMTRNFETVP